jgi:hypothetical protein
LASTSVNASRPSALGSINNFKRGITIGFVCFFFTGMVLGFLQSRILSQSANGFHCPVLDHHRMEYRDRLAIGIASALRSPPIIET